MGNTKTDVIFRAIGEIDTDLLEEFETLNTTTIIKHTLPKKIGFSSLAVASIFVIMVNLSPTFALACSSIPFIEKLAKAVDFSYSLTRAVEENFVQVIGETKTQDGITITIEHLIVDETEVNIFFTLEGDTNYKYLVTPSPVDENWYSMSSDVGNIEKSDDLRSVSIRFRDNQIPSTLYVDLQVERIEFNTIPEKLILDGDEPPIIDYYTTIPFVLEVDSYFTEQSREYDVNQTIELNGQSIIFTNLEVHPTQMKLKIQEAESNTKDLKFLEYYLLNPKGEVLEGARTGILSSSDSTDDNTTIYHMETDFFDNSESLTLVITGSKWLDKSQGTVKLDLVNQQADWLHENETFSCELTPNGYILHFDTPLTSYEDEDGTLVYDFGFNAWSIGLYDEDGTQIKTVSSSIYSHTQEGETVEVSRFSIPIPDYFEDYVWIAPTYGEVTREFVEVKLY